MNLDNFNEALDYLTKELSLSHSPKTQYSNESKAKVMSRHLQESGSFKKFGGESSLNHSFELGDISSLVKMLLDYIAKNPFC